MRDAAPSQAIERRELRLPPVQGRDGPLGLLQVRPAEGAPHPIPVVLLHGATFGSAMFDIPVPGYSFQAFLAARGWNNFALDVRGYGRSGPCPVLDAPPEENPPYARLDDAVEDLAAGVRLALEESGAATAHVVGFSWGTVVASAFAERYPALIERLVLYAPLHGEVNDLWIERIGDPDDRTRVNPRLGAYRWVGLEDIVSPVGFRHSCRKKRRGLPRTPGPLRDPRGAGGRRSEGPRQASAILPGADRGAGRSVRGLFRPAALRSGGHHRPDPGHPRRGRHHLHIERCTGPFRRAGRGTKALCHDLARLPLPLRRTQRGGVVRRDRLILAPVGRGETA